MEEIDGDKVDNLTDVDKVLLAIGRSPNTKELNLPAMVGSEFFKDFLENKGLFYATRCN